MKKYSVKNLVENRLLKNGVVSNWEMIDERLTTRLSDIILHLRSEGWQIITEFDPQKSKNCWYRLDQNYWRKVVINGGITSYYEKI